MPKRVRSRRVTFGLGSSPKHDEGTKRRVGGEDGDKSGGVSGYHFNGRSFVIDPRNSGRTSEVECEHWMLVSSRLGVQWTPREWAAWAVSGGDHIRRVSGNGFDRMHVYTAARLRRRAKGTFPILSVHGALDCADAWTGRSRGFSRDIYCGETKEAEPMSGDAGGDTAGHVRRRRLGGESLRRGMMNCSGIRTDICYAESITRL